MKKLTHDQKMWLQRHALRAASRRSSKSYRSAGRRLAVGYRQGKRTHVWVSKDALKLPRVLCFDTNYDETAAFFDNLGKELCKNAAMAKYKVKYRHKLARWCDFSTLEFISPSAGLVLAAEYERGKIISKFDGLHTINMHQWKPGPRQTLIDLGLLSLLGIDPQSDGNETAKHIVQFQSDRKVEMSKASRTLRDVIVLAATASVLLVENDELKNFRTFLQAIGEALNNTSDHAYPANQPTDLPNVGRWWITGAVDPAERLMTFAVYDQGVSIPRAIPHGRRFQNVRRFFKRWVGVDFDPNDTEQDGRAIAAAVRGGVSGTGLEHRGRGMGLMRDYIRTERNGRLRIVSRHGDFVACTGRRDQQSTRAIPLRGTLVEWTVNL